MWRKIKSYIPDQWKEFYFKTKLDSVYALLKVSYLLQAPRLTAMIWVLLSKKEITSNLANYSATSIVFDSPGGLDDIRAAFREDTPDYQILSLDGEVIKSLERYIYGCNFGDYEFYLSTKDLDLKNKTYQMYLEQIVQHLIHLIKLKLVINFNFVYEAQRPLMSVCRRVNIPFVTVMKECLRTPGYIEGTIQIYKERIVSVDPSLILVHNEQTKSLIEKSEIYPDGRIRIIGQPRSDRLIEYAKLTKAKSVTETRKRILFFAISETAGLPYFGERTSFDEESERLLGSSFKWTELIEKTYNVLCDYAISRDDIDLIVKGKPTGVYGFNRVKHGSISYLHGNPDINLILSADLVVGFNTTGLLEALAANIPAISSELDLDLIPGISKFLFNFQGAIPVAKDKNQLLELISTVIDSKSFKIESSTRKDILDIYLGNADGQSGKRLRYELDLILNQ